MSEIELDIMLRDGAKDQAADALSALKTHDEDKTAVAEEVPVLTVSKEVFACSRKTE